MNKDVGIPIQGKPRLPRMSGKAWLLRKRRILGKPRITGYQDYHRTQNIKNGRMADIFAKQMKNLGFFYLG